MENRTFVSIRSLRRGLLAASLVALLSTAVVAQDDKSYASSVNDASLSAPVGAGASGAATLRAQILLERANFSPGEIDGSYGGNMKLAIAAFQSAKGIKSTGEVDADTWTALNAQGTADLLVEYRLTEADVAGPFAKIPAEMADKAKLPALGYTSSIEAIGEKFHASPGLLRRLNPEAGFDKAGDRILVPNVADIALAGEVAKIVVDKSDSGLQLLDAGGKVLARYPASTGSEHDPLPVGDWKVTAIAMDPVFHYNPDLFWDADPKNEKAKIAPGPNNPVGTVWIDLSKEHYGVHGTPEPSKIGKTESHGCIRLTNWSARTVAAAIKAGTPVLLQD